MVGILDQNAFRGQVSRRAERQIDLLRADKLSGRDAHSVDCNCRVIGEAGAIDLHN